MIQAAKFAPAQLTRTLPLLCFRWRSVPIGLAHTVKNASGGRVPPKSIGSAHAWFDQDFAANGLGDETLFVGGVVERVERGTVGDFRAAENHERT